MKALIKSFAYLILMMLICIYVNVNNVDADNIKMQLIQNAISNNQLVMGFQAEGVFTEKVIRFLDRGFTVKIEYRIELWKSRPYWFDQLNNQYYIGYQINFDPLEKRYICIRTQQDRVTDSRLDREREKIIQWSTTIDKPLSIISLDQLDQNLRYYYNIEILVATLTSENIKDLQKWLGDFKNKREEQSTITKTTFKVATDFISSRNHKKASMRTEKFDLKDLPKIGK